MEYRQPPHGNETFTEEMKDLIKAKALLCSEGYTCVMCREDAVFTSTERGVKPLVAWLESEDSMKDFCAADKVVGKATAFLYVLLGVKAVYAHVISKSALQTLRAYHVTVEYGQLAENIINRRGDGICPFEAAVLEVTEPADAYEAIRRKMREMHMVI